MLHLMNTVPCCCCECDMDDPWALPKSEHQFMQQLQGNGIERHQEQAKLCDPVAIHSHTPERVILNTYHLIKSRTNRFLYKIGFGLFHTGVEVYGTEYSFGQAMEVDQISGVFLVAPKQALSAYHKSIDLGVTTMTPGQVAALIAKLEHEWTCDTYHVLHNNCNHFTRHLCRLLSTVEPLITPNWTNRAARLGDFFIPMGCATWIAGKCGGGPPKAETTLETFEAHGSGEVARSEIPAPGICTSRPHTPKYDRGSIVMPNFNAGREPPADVRLCQAEIDEERELVEGEERTGTASTLVPSPSLNASTFPVHFPGSMPSPSLQKHRDAAAGIETAAVEIPVSAEEPCQSVRTSGSEGRVATLALSMEWVDESRGGEIQSSTPVVAPQQAQEGPQEPRLVSPVPPGESREAASPPPRPLPLPNNNVNRPDTADVNEVTIDDLPPAFKEKSADQSSLPSDCADNAAPLESCSPNAKEANDMQLEDVGSPPPNKAPEESGAN